MNGHSEYQELLPQAVEVAHEVGAHVEARHSSTPVAADDMSAVLAAFHTVDDPAAALLRRRLGAIRPQAVSADDELGPVVAMDGEMWVCDAIDGAVQFLQGLPYWGVSIALVRDGEPVLAVLWMPRLDLLYTAIIGGGARLNGRPVTASRKKLAAALVCTSQPPFNTEPERAGTSLTAMLRHTLAVRNLGPTSLQIAQVASGHVDAFWEYGEDANNLLPGALIAREGGAIVTDADGNPWHPTSTSFLAAAPTLHADVLKVLGTPP
ncbi:inositol monophosphatase family protein [Pseudonocardia hispaniensis]|uniref:Inositol monophosphatase family protein n=1 Tax=Pseudonocardia hispaniensis TaxID=904933 RepID=A0ABW1J5H6_9PSEU